MRYFYLLCILLSISVNSQNVEDDFEGSGTITSWYADNCNMNIVDSIIDLIFILSMMILFIILLMMLIIFLVLVSLMMQMVS